MILVIDNYDSFTYNIVQYLGEMGQELVVRRNDKISLDEIAAMAPDKLLISPGPCDPEHAGISVATIERFAGKIPILGVCLGHQSIGHAFGGKIVRAGRLMHGKTSPILHNGQGVFQGMPQPFAATRYHSLLIERDSLPDCLEITAETAEGEIMGVRHKTLDVEGVQFHPESVLTIEGKRILQNFVDSISGSSAPKVRDRESGGKGLMEALKKLVNGAHLTGDEAAAAMTRIMDGEATPAQIAGLLTALRLKGETVEEITGFARVMRERSIHVPTTRRPLVDTCGTGGDTCKTFNVSTAAAIVAAAGGASVAKHGNRAVTSKCGSADVLEALGVRIDLTPEAVGGCINKVGIGFLFARSHHPAMKYAAGPRAELGIRTVFNALGPLTNPAGATRQVVGVYDADLCPVLARVLLNLGAEHVLVVHGRVGLDEIATFGETVVSEGRDSHVETYTLTAAALGLVEGSPETVAPGADAAANAAILLGVLGGSDGGARRDLVVANAAAALYVAGITSSIAEGVTFAGKLIDSGAAREKLESLRRFTQEAAR